MNQESHPPALVERGVYWARYTKNGRPIAYAVDSKGDVVRRLVPQEQSPVRLQAAVDHLWDYLDLVDPRHDARPPLRLVQDRELPSTQRRARVELPDPYNLPPIPGDWRRLR